MENLFLVQDIKTGLFLTSKEVEYYKGEDELGRGKFGQKKDAVLVTQLFFSFQLMGLENKLDCKLIPAN